MDAGVKRKRRQAVSQQAAAPAERSVGFVFRIIVNMVSTMSLFTKDSTLDLFHALGKLLHAKRMSFSFMMCAYILFRYG
jgi:hypothetical protein